LNQQINTSLEKNPQAKPYLGGSLESLCEYRFGLFGKEHHFYLISLGPAISNTLHPSLVVTRVPNSAASEQANLWKTPHAEGFTFQRDFREMKLCQHDLFGNAGLR
jgi:hypothetical protein